MKTAPLPAKRRAALLGVFLLAGLAAVDLVWILILWEAIRYPFDRVFGLLFYSGWTALLIWVGAEVRRGRRIASALIAVSIPVGMILIGALIMVATFGSQVRTLDPARCGPLACTVVWGLVTVVLLARVAVDEAATRNEGE